MRAAVDWVHIKVRFYSRRKVAKQAFIIPQGTLKQETVDDMEKYVVKDKLLGEMLRRLSVNAKVFLLTNSDWWYSNVSYLFAQFLSAI